MDCVCSITLGSTSELCITTLSEGRLESLEVPTSSPTEPQGPTQSTSHQLCSSSLWRKPLISWGWLFLFLPTQGWSPRNKRLPLSEASQWVTSSQTHCFLFFVISGFGWASLGNHYYTTYLKERVEGLGIRDSDRGGRRWGFGMGRLGVMCCQRKCRKEHFKVTIWFESIPFCSDIFNLLQSQTILSLTFGQACRIGT